MQLVGCCASSCQLCCLFLAHVPHTRVVHTHVHTCVLLSCVLHPRVLHTWCVRVVRELAAPLLTPSCAWIAAPSHALD